MTPESKLLQENWKWIRYKVKKRWKYAFPELVEDMFQEVCVGFLERYPTDSVLRATTNPVTAYVKLIMRTTPYKLLRYRKIDQDPEAFEDVGAVVEAEEQLYRKRVLRDFLINLQTKGIDKQKCVWAYAHEDDKFRRAWCIEFGRSEKEFSSCWSNLAIAHRRKFDIKVSDTAIGRRQTLSKRRKRVCDYEGCVNKRIGPKYCKRHKKLLEVSTCQ